MLRNCTSQRYAVNKERMMRVAEYSRDCLQALRAETGIQYEQRAGGTLQLFRTDKQLTMRREGHRCAGRMRRALRTPRPRRLCGVEPALAADGAHAAGGLRLPNDETGDCQRSRHALAMMPPTWA